MGQENKIAVSISLTPRQYENVKKLAERYGCSMASIVRIASTRLIEQEGEHA